MNASRRFKPCKFVLITLSATLACNTPKTTMPAPPSGTQVQQPEPREKHHIGSVQELARFFWDGLARGITVQQVATALGAQVKATESKTTFAVTGHFFAAGIHIGAADAHSAVDMVHVYVNVEEHVRLRDMQQVAGSYRALPPGKNVTIVFDAAVDAGESRPYFAADLYGPKVTSDAVVTHLRFFMKK